jgi:hypothetical protein
MNIQQRGLNRVKPVMRTFLRSWNKEKPTRSYFQTGSKKVKTMSIRSNSFPCYSLVFSRNSHLNSSAFALFL